jgi:hypothetical protein
MNEPEIKYGLRVIERKRDRKERERVRKRDIE